MKHWVLSSQSMVAYLDPFFGAGGRCHKVPSSLCMDLWVKKWSEFGATGAENVVNSVAGFSDFYTDKNYQKIPQQGVILVKRKKVLFMSLRML